MTISRKRIRQLLVWGLVLFGVSILYRLNPYRVEFLGHYDKVWAHKANSTEKLTSALKWYDGVELDLVYVADGNYFDITHPPDPSTGLRLEDYLQEIKKQPYLWLDVKNLYQHNSEDVLDRLLELFWNKKYPYENVLIETQNPDALPIFEENGFKTSYYLPFGLSKMNSSELKKEIERINTVLLKQPELGISSNYEDYGVMTNHFPNRNKYLWMIDGIQSHGLLKPRKILSDSTVVAVLVKFKAE